MNNIGTKVIETERLILRPFIITDANDMFNNWATDEMVNRYLSWDLHKDIEETKEILTKWISNYNNDNYYNWAIELKDTKEVIGNIADVGVDKKQDIITLGYCIGSKWWNNGYVTEAFRKVLEFLLLEEKFHLVQTTYRDTNPASGRVMEKCGMKKDGVLRLRRKDKITGEYADQIIYSMIKEDL